MTQARIMPRPNWNQSFWNPDSASIRSPVPCRWAARAIWVSSAIQLFDIFSQVCRLLYKFRLLNLYHSRIVRLHRTVDFAGSQSKEANRCETDRPGPKRYEGSTVWPVPGNRV